MIEAVLFDLGDTLLECERIGFRRFIEPFGASSHQWLLHGGYRPPGLRSYQGRLGRRFVGACIWSRVIRREVDLLHQLQVCHRRMGVALGSEQVLALCLSSVPAMRPLFRPTDDAAMVLDGLHQSGIKLGIVSNTVFPPAVIDVFLREEGLIEYLPVRVYSSEVRYMKPHPRIFRTALDQLGVRAERTLFVGDRWDKDIVGASRLGMKTALLARHDCAARYRVPPDHRIRRLREVLELTGSEREFRKQPAWPQAASDESSHVSGETTLLAGPKKAIGKSVLQQPVRT